MILNRIYETQNLLSLKLVSFLVGLRNYQHSCRNMNWVDTGLKRKLEKSLSVWVLFNVSTFSMSRTANHSNHCNTLRSNWNSVAVKHANQNICDILALLSQVITFQGIIRQKCTQKLPRQVSIPLKQSSQLTLGSHYMWLRFVGALIVTLDETGRILAIFRQVLVRSIILGF